MHVNTGPKPTSLKSGSEDALVNSRNKEVFDTLTTVNLFVRVAVALPELDVCCCSHFKMEDGFMKLYDQCPGNIFSTFMPHVFFQTVFTMSLNSAW